jgi:uncharacterized protein (DUF58 family)
MRTMLMVVSCLWLVVDVSVLHAHANDDAVWFVVLFGVLLVFLLVSESSRSNQSTRYYRRK